jgi:hypothetical protein
MIAPSVFKEIRNTPSLQPYIFDALAFLAYLRKTANIRFQVYGERQSRDSSTPEDVTWNLPYIHRWTPIYRSGILAKFYQLEDWYKQNPSPITLLTLTTYHDTNKWGGKAHSIDGEGITIPESFCLLKNSWVYLRHAINYYLPVTPWCWIMEPHKSGFPHLHTVLFTDVKEDTQTAIKTLWSKNYKAGSFEHGADFEVSKPENSIASIRNYLMKYIAKTFISTGSKFGEGDAWGAGEIVFNALTWKNGWRLFGTSRDLCTVMAYNKVTDDTIKWYATELLVPGDENRLVWQLREPTGWKNHTRVYREIPKNPIIKEVIL